MVAQNKHEYWKQRSIIQNQTRIKVWRRDDSRCIVCSETATQVHEIIPKSALPGIENLEILFALKNRCCLCDKHHTDETHTVWARRTLLGLLRMRYEYDYSERPFSKYF